MGEEIDEVVECVVAVSGCKGQLQRVQVDIGAKAGVTVLRQASHHVHSAAPQSKLFFVAIRRDVPRGGDEVYHQQEGEALGHDSECWKVER